ncbi:hypothetical protein Taro_048884 [Colocasia esculenta]|uniref:Uncharacterized protein n=1 Tax=Colocasia esculenta TaxID=4460 RepID=A0A843X9I1_COLES|nr:hypothetical protein [Colocasia esculenta]
MYDRDDFTAYADVCFREFGDRVSHWTTLNEPNILAIGGYDVGFGPPFRCSIPYGSNCEGGDSTLEPYIVAHHCLLAHAAAASLYKAKYQAKQQGLIGLNVFVYHFLPLTSSQEDITATQRAHDFYTGWFVEPLVYGDYPRTMKERTGSKMPCFWDHQRKQMMDSYDFLGINHYATLWVSDEDGPSNATTYQRDFNGDLSVKMTVRSSVDSLEFPITPYGMQGALEYFKHAYRNPPLYIHENGYSTPHNSSLEDVSRVKYMEAYIGSLLDAVRNGSNARGYFTWSFLDVFELMDGHRSSYGLYHVDFAHKDLQRRPKLSAHWYSHFLCRNVKLLQHANTISINMGEQPNHASIS